MATGTVKWFADGLLNLGKKQVDLSTDTLKLGIITNAVVPSVSMSNPCWGTGGSTNLSSTQVAIGGTVYQGPVTLAGTTWTTVSGVPTLRASTVNLAQDAASGLINGAYGIIYSDTSTNKVALGWVEISASGAASLVSGPITIDWSGATNDILTITQS